MLDLFDVTKETFNLISSTVEIVIELGVHLITAIDLGLKVLHSAINISQGALLGAVFGLLIFQMGFELGGQLMLAWFLLVSFDHGDSPL